MTDNLTARDLAISFAQVRASQSLREALHSLVALQSDRNKPNVLGVLDDDDRFVGLLTARLLFKSLLTLWMPGPSLREDDERLETELLTVIEERADLAVHDALIRGLPTAAPDDRLLTLIELVCDQRLEYLPVVENEKLLGVVPVTAIFLATARLALTQQDEGIRFE